MADVFINYSRTDRAIGTRIANFLESKGLSLFWDRTIPAGKTFTEVIEEALVAAKCVITIWSKDSVHSQWVKAEADFALKQNKLFPIAISSDVQIPLPFRVIQTEFIDLSDFGDDERLEKLYHSVHQFLNESQEKNTVPFQAVHTVRPADRGSGRVRKKAFISYADEDEEIAIDLVKHLESSGCPCWISFRDVDPGDDYRASITRAMDEIAFLVLIYSEHVNTSFDIATELILARKRRKRRFVLKTDITEPAGPIEYELATVQWIDCLSDPQTAFEKIAQRAELL